MIYGIPHKYLLRWKREGSLNTLSGLVIQSGRTMLDRAIVEKLFQLAPIRKTKANHNGAHLSA